VSYREKESEREREKERYSERDRERWSECVRAVVSVGWKHAAVWIGPALLITGVPRS
jgi:hypothetical protein